MKINKNNYEAYFIDYLEGNLDKRFVDDFIEFLQQNPDLNEELSLLGTVSVEPENIFFNKKENLFKQKLDSEKEFENTVIADLEGDISNLDKQEFENYITEHPEKEREVILFGKTKLEPDKTILFDKKRKLYHNSKQKVFLIWSARIAAILIIAFAFFTLIDKQPNELVSENRVVKVDDKKNKKATAPKLIEIPVKIKKKEQVEIIENHTKQDEKEVVTKKENRSLRKKNTKKVKNKDQEKVRVKTEIPPKLNSITASLTIQNLKTNLAVMHISIPENYNSYNDEKLLADVIKEKTGFDSIHFNEIARAGLNMVTSISNKKFNYETDNEGKIVKYNYNSRLLAFSIPTRSKPAEK